MSGQAYMNLLTKSADLLGQGAGLSRVIEDLVVED